MSPYPTCIRQHLLSYMGMVGRHRNRCQNRYRNTEVSQRGMAVPAETLAKVGFALAVSVRIPWTLSRHTSKQHQALRSLPPVSVLVTTNCNMQACTSIRTIELAAVNMIKIVEFIIEQLAQEHQWCGLSSQTDTVPWPVPVCVQCSV